MEESKTADEFDTVSSKSITSSTFRDTEIEEDMASNLMKM